VNATVAVYEAIGLTVYWSQTNCVSLTKTFFLTGGFDGTLYNVDTVDGTIAKETITGMWTDFGVTLTNPTHTATLVPKLFKSG
jgi:hypothetical protein